MSRLRADLDTMVGTAAGSYVLPNTRAVTDNFVLEYDNSGYVTVAWDEYRVAARSGYIVKRSLDEDGNDVDWNALTGYLWYWTGTIVTPDAGRFTVTREPLIWYDEQEPTPPIDRENAINLELAYDAIVDTLIAAGGAFQVDERGFAFGDPPPTYDESAGTYTGTGVLGHTPGIVGVLADVLQFKLDETGLELLDDAKLGINIAISDMDANTRVHIYETGDSNDAAILIEDVSDTQHGGLKLYRSRVGPAATQADDTFGSITARGYAASAYVGGPQTMIRFKAAENTTDSAQGSYIVIETTPTGSTYSSRREVVRIDQGGKVLIGDTVDTGVTVGLTINQGANDDKILTLKSSDVAHPFTANAEADTYGFMSKAEAGSGGLLIAGLKDSDDTAGLALQLQGRLGEAADTTKTTAAIGVVDIRSQITDGGTGIADVGANGNLLTVRNRLTCRFILDAEGDSHQDVGTAWTNFDTHDDLALLNLLSAHVTRVGDPLRESFGDWLAQSRDELERLKLVTFNDDGHHFVNWSRMQMLLVGAVRQLGAEIAQLKEGRA